MQSKIIILNNVLLKSLTWEDSSSTVLIIYLNIR